MQNKVELTFPSISRNEALARVAAGAVALQLDPTMSELNDIKTAVSEAVTNAIVHGYAGCTGTITMRVMTEDRVLTIEIKDDGCGIEDIEKARQPFYTTGPEEERSGMGFTVMETFMDELQVLSTPGGGTLVRMKKQFSEKDGGEEAL